MDTGETRTDSGHGAGPDDALDHDPSPAWPAVPPPALTETSDIDRATLELLTDALVSACALSVGLGCSVARMVVAGGRLVDLEVLAVDPTMQRLIPGMAPGVRVSQLLTPERLNLTLWRVWSHKRLRRSIDNRDNAVPEMLSGAVFDAVQLVAGSLVVWLSVDHSHQQHWQERALQAATAAQETVKAATDQLTRVAEQMFDVLIVWTLVRDQNGAVSDAVIAELNRAAAQLVAGPVRVGRRLSQLVAPQYLQLVLDHFEQLTRSGDVDARVFGPDDLEVHLIQALHGRVRLFAAGTDTIMAIFADDTALTEAATQARRTLHRLAQVRDDEGRRLATVLHDGPLQALTSARWELEAARGEVNGAAGEALRRAQASLDNAEMALRAEIFSLSPPSLDRTGVFVAIAELAERVRTDARDVSVTLDGESRLSRADETLLVRCVQELLRNIDQHTTATQVGVRVVADDQVVCVTVTDDGDGFDASNPAVWLGREHFGLASCKLLLELAGGGMWVESAADSGAGTDASCWLPQAGDDSVVSLPGAGQVPAHDLASLWRASLSAAAIRQDFEHRNRASIAPPPDPTGPPVPSAQSESEGVTCRSSGPVQP